MMSSLKWCWCLHKRWGEGEYEKKRGGGGGRKDNKCDGCDGRGETETIATHINLIGDSQLIGGGRRHRLCS